MSKRRRKLEKEGLKKIKREFNSGTPINELYKIDIYTDNRRIKIKSRQCSVDIIERRAPNARLTIAAMC